MSDPKPPHNDVFRTEAAAEAAQQKLVNEAQRGVQNKCPDCGALGSLEEQEDGTERCVDCDLVLGAARKLGGYGRK